VVAAATLRIGLLVVRRGHRRPGIVESIVLNVRVP
jgi:hypothetical protein